MVKAKYDMTKVGVNKALLSNNRGVWHRKLNLSKAKERCQAAHPERQCVFTYDGKDKVYPSGYMVECPAFNKKVQIGVSYQCV